MNHEQLLDYVRLDDAMFPTQERVEEKLRLLNLRWVDINHDVHHHVWGIMILHHRVSFDEAYGPVDATRQYPIEMRAHTDQNGALGPVKFVFYPENGHRMGITRGRWTSDPGLICATSSDPITSVQYYGGNCRDAEEVLDMVRGMGLHIYEVEGNYPYMVVYTTHVWIETVHPEEGVTYEILHIDH